MKNWIEIFLLTNKYDFRIIHISYMSHAKIDNNNIVPFWICYKNEYNETKSKSNMNKFNT